MRDLARAAGLLACLIVCDGCATSSSPKLVIEARRPAFLEGYFFHMGKWNHERQTYVGARILDGYPRRVVMREILAHLRHDPSALGTELGDFWCAPPRPMTPWPDVGFHGHLWVTRVQPREVWAIVLGELSGNPVWTSPFDTELDKEARVRRVIAAVERTLSPADLASTSAR